MPLELGQQFLGFAVLLVLGVLALTLGIACLVDAWFQVWYAALALWAGLMVVGTFLDFGGTVTFTGLMAVPVSSYHYARGRAPDSARLTEGARRNALRLGVWSLAAGAVLLLGARLIGA